jgi:GTP cyclohydrolase II
MSYLVLARKWRPQRFDDLVGQDHVSKTLATDPTLHNRTYLDAKRDKLGHFLSH